MAINMSSKDFIDTALEVTAIKSRVLLTETDVLRLSPRHPGLDPLVNYLREDEHWLRIGFDEIDECIVALRKAIGNLPDDRDYMAYMVQEMETRIFSRASADVADAAQDVVKQLIDEGAINDSERIFALCSERDLDPQIVIDYILIMDEMQNRSSLQGGMTPRTAVWDGTTRLSDLFDREIQPRKDLTFFDQEFINYLHENSDDLDRIHWRNFERLVAEFFSSIGYQVNLGPGQNDGGIDLRIYNKSRAENGPPLIIVQCKRYGSGGCVDISTVKALYADILDEGAPTGLIATTSRIAPGGKKVIRARDYPISVAEAKQIKDLITGMWTQHYFPSADAE